MASVVSQDPTPTATPPTATPPTATPPTATPPTATPVYKYLFVSTTQCNNTVYEQIKKLIKKCAKLTEQEKPDKPTINKFNLDMDVCASKSQKALKKAIKKETKEPKEPKEPEKDVVLVIIGSCLALPLISNVIKPSDQIKVVGFNCRQPICNPLLAKATNCLCFTSVPSLSNFNALTNSVFCFDKWYNILQFPKIENFGTYLAAIKGLSSKNYIDLYFNSTRFICMDKYLNCSDKKVCAALLKFLSIFPIDPKPDSGCYCKPYKCNKDSGCGSGSDSCSDSDSSNDDCDCDGETSSDDCGSNGEEEEDDNEDGDNDCKEEPKDKKKKPSKGKTN
jgi:hypothetical protein